MSERARGNKRKQLFTERAVKRALRAGGNGRTLRIRPDGTLELVPAVAEGADTEPRDTSWDDLKDNAQE
jgi:hypothetical protein